MDATGDDLTEVVGVLGAGLMGGGIAALLCASGFTVKVYDESAKQLDALGDKVAAVVDELERNELAPAGVSTKIGERLRVASGYADFADCGTVIEAIFENKDIKKAAYAQLEQHIAPTAMIGSSTSNIVPSTLAPGLRHPERFLVTHFWNPPHAVPLVEVVPHAGTAPEIVDKAMRLIKRMGNEPVLLKKEVAGFVGNRLQVALLREALWIVQHGIADPEEVDRVMTLSIGRRYAITGPCATADLGGLDTFTTISQQLMPQLCADTAPIAVMETIVAAGDKGAKTGRGLLDWPGDRAQKLMAKRNGELLERRKRERQTKD